MAHLWTKDAAPLEYITHVVSRDVWHCTYQEAKQQPASDFVTALVILAAEGEVAKAESRKR